MLVLAEVWVAGWTATVDGDDAPVDRANHTLRAVPIPAGTSTVELRYTPVHIELGLVVSSVALLRIAVLLARGFRLPKRLREKDA